jgi:hypothetical protein
MGAGLGEAEGGGLRICAAPLRRFALESRQLHAVAERAKTTTICHIPTDFGIDFEQIQLEFTVALL